MRGVSKGGKRRVGDFTGSQMGGEVRGTMKERRGSCFSAVQKGRGLKKFKTPSEEIGREKVKAPRRPEDRKRARGKQGFFTKKGVHPREVEERKTAGRSSSISANTPKIESNAGEVTGKSAQWRVASGIPGRLGCTASERYANGKKEKNQKREVKESPGRTKIYKRKNKGVLQRARLQTMLIPKSKGESEGGGRREEKNRKKSRWSSLLLGS